MAADREHLVNFAAAAARNAGHLLGDAELLLAGKRWPGAQALAALACEEFGKAGGALVLSIVPAEHRRRANPAALMGWHQVKMLGALMMRLVAFDQPGVLARVMGLAGLAEVLREVEAEAAAANKTKMRALYADMDADGHVRVPEKEIGEAQAQAAVERAREVARAAAQLSEPLYLAALADPPPEVVNATMPLFIACLDSVPTTAGPDEAAAAVMSFAQQVQSLAAPAADDSTDNSVTHDR
jgi:AbiV family abortive infection protein